MDYIILNSDGSLAEKSLSHYIQQGSTGVDQFFIGYDGALTTDVCQAVFTLPNQTTVTELGTFGEDYDYDGENTADGWTFTLTTDETTYNGIVVVAIRIIRDGTILVTYPFSLVINETGVMPDTDTGVTIEEIDTYLENLATITANYISLQIDEELSTTSENAVQNLVVTAALNEKVILYDSDSSGWDTTPTSDSTNPITSGGVYSAILNAIANVYKYIGSLTVDEINALDTSTLEVGYVYNVTDDGTLTEGSVVVSAGDNVAWTGSEWDMLASYINMSNYVDLTSEQTISGAKTFTADTYFAGNIVSSYGSYNNWTIKSWGSNYVFAHGDIEVLKLYDAKIEAIRNFLPSSNNSLDLGSSSYYWKDLYLSGTAYIGSLGSYIGLYSNSLYLYSSTSDIRVNSKIRPINNSCDLGDSNYYWKNLYLSGNLSDGTNTVSVADIVDVNNLKTINGNSIYESGGGDLSVVASSIMTKVAEGVSTYTLAYGTPYLIVLKSGDSITINGVSYYGTFFITHTNYYTTDTGSGVAGAYGSYGIVDIGGTRITYSSTQTGTGSPSSAVQTTLTITCSSGSNLDVYSFN